MRLIRKNVEREAEGSAAEKLISDGFTPMKEATPDTVPESLCSIHRVRNRTERPGETCRHLSGSNSGLYSTAMVDP